MATHRIAYVGRCTPFVDLTDSMARRAAELAIRYGLRGTDSVHLAAALAVPRTCASRKPRPRQG